MVTATPDVVEEVFALIFEEGEPPCNILPPTAGTCPRAARWAWRCPSCSVDFMACDGHRTQFDREMAGWTAVHPLRAVACPLCFHGPLPTPFTWRPI